MSATLRLIEMLRLIPREPRRITTRSLQARLADAGYETTLRTIQRDLNNLSVTFPLICHDGGWSWAEQASAQSLPGMDSATALTFCLAEEYLSQMFPSGLLNLMQPHFEQAKKILESGGSDLAHWHDKIRILPRYQPLIPPKVDPRIAATIYDALLHGKQIQVHYRPRNGKPRDYLLSPHGLAFRDAVTYLVASHRDYDNILMYALHRFDTAEPTGEKARKLPDFDFDDWIRKGGFAVSKAPEAIRLKARFDADVGDHLLETPLSEDQTAQFDEQGKIIITATVMDTMQLEWWLNGFGNKLEVLGPEHYKSFRSKNSGGR